MPTLVIVNPKTDQALELEHHCRISREPYWSMKDLGEMLPHIGELWLENHLTADVFGRRVSLVLPKAEQAVGGLIRVVPFAGKLLADEERS